MKKRFKKLVVLGMVVAMMASSTLCASAAGLRDVFNAKYYADSYADLKAAFGDNEEALYNHFINYGLKENRHMSPIIDVQAYRKAYPDLNAAFGENWDAYVEHFLAFGAREGRTQGILFNPIKYAEAYPDVAAAFGTDIQAITNHYLTHGVAEGRTAGVTAAAPAAPAAAASGGGSSSSSSSSSGSGSGSGGTTTPPAETKTDAEKLQEAAEAVTEALGNLILGNKMTDEEVEAAIDEAARNAAGDGITFEWKGAMNVVLVSGDTDGSVTGEIRLSIEGSDAEPQNVAVNVPIRSNKSIMDDAETVVNAALSAVELDKGMSTAVLKQTVLNAVQTAVGSDITAEWDSVTATPVVGDTDGSVSGTIKLTLKEDTSVTKDVSVSLTIESDGTLLNSAKTAAEGAISSVEVKANDKDTLVAAVAEAVDAAIAEVNSGITADYSALEFTAATGAAAGALAGVITLTLDESMADTNSISVEIPKLEITAVESPADAVEVAYGTSEDDAKAAVKAVSLTGTWADLTDIPVTIKGEAEVTITGYNASKAGNYTATIAANGLQAEGYGIKSDLGAVSVTVSVGLPTPAKVYNLKVNEAGTGVALAGEAGDVTITGGDGTSEATSYKGRYDGTNLTLVKHPTDPSYWFGVGALCSSAQDYWVYIDGESKYVNVTNNRIPADGASVTTGYQKYGIGVAFDGGETSGEHTVKFALSDAGQTEINNASNAVYYEIKVVISKPADPEQGSDE